MIIQYRQNTTNNLSSIYKSGNMFQLIEPSSIQFTNHTEGTFSRRAHCAHLLTVPSICFENWIDDGLMSRNMLPDLQTDDKLLVVF
jgi:hypothetical protein